MIVYALLCFIGIAFLLLKFDSMDKRIEKPPPPIIPDKKEIYTSQCLSAYNHIRKTYLNNDDTFNVINDNILTVLTEHAENVRNEIEGTNAKPSDIIWYIILRTIMNELPYAEYYIYGGMLNKQGMKMYNLFITAAKELKKSSYYTKEQYKESMGWLIDTVNKSKHKKN